MKHFTVLVFILLGAVIVGTTANSTPTETKLAALVAEPTQVEAALITPEYPADVVTLATKIKKWKRKVDHNIWHECGKRYEVSEIYPAALEWSNAILTAHKKTRYKHKQRMIPIELREALGLIENESKFDRCAVGPHPRKFAYRHKLLERKNNNISHSLEEWEKVFTHPKFKHRPADLGPGQIVKRGLTWEEAKQYLSINPGVQLVFNLLARRGRYYRTNHPSSRWPGSANHSWYTLKVRQTGASILRM